MSTSQGCGSHLRHKLSLSFTHRLPRTLELTTAAWPPSSTKDIFHEDEVDRDVDTDPLPSRRRRTQSMIASSRAISTISQHFHKPRNLPSIHDGLIHPRDPRPKYPEIAWQNHGQAKPTTTKTGFINNGDRSLGAQS